MKRILVVGVVLVLGTGLIGWQLLPSHYCGVHCGISWLINLQNMTRWDHMIQEAAEDCRNNPDLVRELDFSEICEGNYSLEEQIVNQKNPSIGRIFK